MSDKDIKIGIGLTGAEQTAAGIQKVEKAVDSAADAMGGGKAAGGGLAGGAKKAAAEVEKLEKTGNKVSASGLNLKQTIGQVGYQVQDFAVQVGSGTDALRAFGQQAPQLLGAFGPVGIVLGTIVAIAAPLAAAIGAAVKAAGESEEELDAYAKKLKELREKAADLAGEKSGQKLQEWIDSLGDEGEAYQQQNKDIKIQLDLLAARKAAQGRLEEAERDLAAARIAFNPNLDEATKIRELAAIREESERAKARQKLDELDKKRDDTLRAAQEAGGDQQNKTEALRKAEQRLAELKAEELELETKLKLSKRGKEVLDQIDAEGKLPEARKDLELLEGGRRSKSGGTLSQMRAIVADLEARRAQAEKDFQAASTADEGRLKGDKGVKVDITTAEAAVADSKKAVEDAAKATATAAQAARTAEGIRSLEKPLIEREYSAQQEARSLATADKLRPLELEAEQKRLQEELARQQESAGLQVIRAIPRGGNPLTAGNAANERQISISRTLRGIGEQLGSADTEQEIDQARGMILESQSLLGEKFVSGLLALAEKNREIVARLSMVEAQIKNSPSR